MSHITLDHAEAERLELLIKEASEVIKAATKILRHGYESYDPTQPAIMRSTNRKDLEEELGDFRAALSRMIRAGDVSRQKIDQRARFKFERGGRYLHYQDNGLRELGKKLEAERQEQNILRRSLQSMRAQDQVIEPMREVKVEIRSEDYEGEVRSPGAVKLEFSLSPELEARLRKHDPETLRSIQSLGYGRCNLPPPGWQCSRPSGHHGPCAAYIDGDGYQPNDDLPPGSNPQPPRSR